MLCHGLRRQQQQRRIILPKAVCYTPPYRQGMDVTIHHSIRAPTSVQPSVGLQRGLVQNTCRPGLPLSQHAMGPDGKARYSIRFCAYLSLSPSSLHNQAVFTRLCPHKAMEWSSRGGRSLPLYIILILLGWPGLCQCLGEILRF